jgi:hypothetical protein
MPTQIEIAAAKNELRHSHKWVWGGSHTRRWHGLPQNILGIGFGTKRSDGRPAGDNNSLRVYVRQKRAKRSLSARERILPKINGYLTDVIPVKQLRSHGSVGCSIGNEERISGTLSCVVRDSAGAYLLSCWHVLTNTYGKDGDPTYLPSLSVDDAAVIAGKLIATPQFHLGGGANAFDASVSKLQPGIELTNSIDGIGAIQLPCVLATQGAAVVKRGAASQLTTGVIDGISEDVHVIYNGDPAQQALLTGQIAIVGDDGTFSLEGDSGAMVCAPNGQPYGIVIGGAQSAPTVPVPHSFASPLQSILDFYQVTIGTTT